MQIINPITYLKDKEVPINLKLKVDKTNLSVFLTSV